MCSLWALASDFSHRVVEMSLQYHKHVRSPTNLPFECPNGSLVGDGHFYLSFCVTFVFPCVIAHCCCVRCFYGYFFTVWKRFVVIKLLWVLKCFKTYSYGISSVVGCSCSWIIVVGMSFVLFCLGVVFHCTCCGFMFVTLMLWLCFLFRAISMAFMFILHYNCSYIVDIFAL
jgi:hypothetical protein